MEDKAHEEKVEVEDSLVEKALKLLEKVFPSPRFNPWRKMMELGFAIIGLGALFGLLWTLRPIKIVDRSDEYDGEYDDIP